MLIYVGLPDLIPKKKRIIKFSIIFVFRIHISHRMVLDWFWIGLGSLAILIYHSLNIQLFAIYMPYIYKGIWHIFWKQMNELSLPKPIQNQS